MLSGGERRRLVLAQLVVSGANFLVLDEPTNHLDIESREALEDALSEFAGTLLFVSHDRALIEALATRTLAIEHGGLTLRDGAFGEYARDHEPSLDGGAKPAEPARRERKPAKPGGGQARPAEALGAQQARGRTAGEARSSRWSRSWAAWRRGSRSRTPTSSPRRWSRTACAIAALQEDLAHLYREWELRVEQ